MSDIITVLCLDTDSATFSFIRNRIDSLDTGNTSLLYRSKFFDLVRSEFYSNIYILSFKLHRLNSSSIF